MTQGPRWTEGQLKEYQAGLKIGPVKVERIWKDDVLAHDAGPKPHKYQAEPTVIDGIRFDSKIEGRYYQLLQIQLAGQAIRGFLRQVPFHLPGRTILRVDFQVFELDGTSWFAEVKGVETDPFKIKIRQVRELYPWADVRIIKKGDF